MRVRFCIHGLRQWLACVCALLSFVLIAVVDAQAQADLSVTKTVSNPTPNVGSNITFTITLTNLGPNAATGVTVTDLLPAGLTFVSATPSQGTYNNTNGVWTVGTLASSASVTLQITATVVSASAQTNTATISHSDQFDPIASNNTASVTVTPGAVPVPTLPPGGLILLMGSLAALAARALHLRRLHS